MKKILLVAAVASLAMVSCKKERKCSCTSTNTSGGTTTTSTWEVTLTKASKKDAKHVCSVNTNETTTSGGTTTSKTDCQLK